MPLSNPVDGILQAVSSTSQSQPSQQAVDGQPQRYKGGYGHTTDHSYDPGVLVLPVASEDSRTVRVRVHGGYSTRTVRFAMTREDNPPILPKPEDVMNKDRTDVLVSCDLHLPLPVPSSTPNHLTWSASGEYVFVGTGLETTVTSPVTVPPASPPVPPVTTTSRTPAARVPGRDLLPLGGYPFSLGLPDRIMSDIAAGNTDLKAYSVSQTPLVATDRHVWPFPIYPTFAFNGNLLRD